MLSLQGKHIAVTGARKRDEVTQLIANFGGIAHIRPAQGTILTDEREIGPAMRRVIAGGADWIILTTGQGAQRLMDVARQSDMLWDWLRLLRMSKVAVRGYKTRRFLKEWVITPDISDDDGTTVSLTRAFGDEPLEGRKVVVQLHGTRPERLLRWLEERGAVVETLMPYIHVPPPEEEIRSFLEEIRERKFDAVAFTSELQVRYLFETAGRFGMKETLRDLLSGEVLAAAVGKVPPRRSRRKASRGCFCHPTSGSARSSSSWRGISRPGTSRRHRVAPRGGMDSRFAGQWASAPNSAGAPSRTGCRTDPGNTPRSKSG